MSADDAQPEVLLVDPDRLHPNEWNPNVVADHVQRALGKNIERAGSNQPVLARPHPTREGEYEIVDGEHRWREHKERGLQVPVIVRPFSTAEAKLQTIAMNRLRGEMEPADVARLIREAEEDGIPVEEQVEFTGYTLEEATNLTKLLDFDWSQYGEAPPGGDNDSAPKGEEEWVDLRFRVPESVAVLMRSELDRLKQIRETEHDHLALELMVVASAQTPMENLK